MSLVNDMLNDLDKRHSAHAPLNTQQSIDLPILNGKNMLKRFQIFIVVAVGFLVLGIWRVVAIAPIDNQALTEVSVAAPHSVEEQSLNSAVEVKNENSNLPVVARQQPHTESQTNLQVLSVASETVPQSQPKPQQTDPIQSKILNLLAQAEEFVQQRQYTTPEFNNALNRYGQVLALDSANTAAREGIELLIARYQPMAEQALRVGNRQRAEVYLQRAIDIAGIYLQGSENQQPQLEKLTALRERLQTEGPATAQQAVSAETVSAEIVSGETRPEPVVEQTPMAVASNPAPVQSIRTERVIPDHQKNLKQAKQLINQGRIQQALQALESDVPQLHEEPEYFALMAALYHQLSRDQEAADLYQQLVAQYRTNFDYWLGLAVCLDALQDKGGALLAFESARRIGSADRQTLYYINQRVKNLSGNG